MTPYRPYLYVFTAQRYASAVLAVVVCLCLSVSRPSVRASVTHRYYVKTAKHRITEITPHDGSVTLNAKGLGDIRTGSSQRGRKLQVE